MFDNETAAEQLIAITGQHVITGFGVRRSLNIIINIIFLFLPLTSSKQYTGWFSVVLLDVI